ncbi:class F sortase [Modestobacter sp. Leaf380]|uniref:class F sortase n=1 Tax=Modestobacter sp. Leaf380 TaxID=1736356 RepID=UPI0006F55720|nr:class F sortase [Modestobacter sp. Leaf380]KQS66001.1 hypothetical protein ASG41_11470 [Modestobacter sp. Leaf380]
MTRYGRARRTSLSALAALLLAGCGSAAAAPDPAPAPAAVSAAAAAPTVAAPVVLTASEPLRVRVPAIGVDSGLVDLGLQADGSLEVPAEGFPAGWFTGSPTPGERGPAVLAGHVDWAGSPGVFAELAQLAPGDAVLVDRTDGSTATFVVTLVDQVAKADFPTEEVYGDLGHAGLRLITCGGEFDGSTGDYLDDVVVYADLVA